MFIAFSRGLVCIVKRDEWAKGATHKMKYVGVPYR
jgi:hypothetical protein